MSTPSKPKNVHEIAVGGFGQGTNDFYDSSRPSYPASAIQIIADALKSPHNEPGNSSAHDGLTILEPGAGTGISSRVLLAPPADYPRIPIRQLIGIEPSEGMRSAWVKGLSKVDPALLEGKRAVIVDGSFEDFSQAGVEKGTVDAVIIAQAWHWCPDYDRAMREAASYLAPGGALILLWNLESQRDEWHKKLRDCYQAHDRGTPQFWKGWWRRCFETAAYEELYRPAEEQTVSWSTPQTEEALTNRLLSKSYLTETYLHGKEREALIANIKQIIREGDKEWIDKENQIFAYHYDTLVVIIRKK